MVGYYGGGYQEDGIKEMENGENWQALCERPSAFKRCSAKEEGRKMNRVKIRHAVLYSCI